jgi:hypothetical protein
MHGSVADCKSGTRSQVTISTSCGRKMTIAAAASLLPLLLLLLFLKSA